MTRYEKMLSELSIQSIRERTGLSQSQFAKKYGFPIHTLQGWEQGRPVKPYWLNLLNRVVNDDLDAELEDEEWEDDLDAELEDEEWEDDLK